jgi:hypothetical protein
VNGAAGAKLPPCPSESPRIAPLCAPLREPLTPIDPSWLAGTPRKVIWVCGEATRPPGIGNVLTGGAAAPAPPGATNSAIAHGIDARLSRNTTRAAVPLSRIPNRTKEENTPTPD